MILKEEHLKQISSSDEEDEQDMKNTTSHSENSKTNSEILSIFPVFSEMTKKQNKKNKKEFSWEQQFASSLTVSIIDTNFESSSVSLHYGNFKVSCTILLSNFPSNIFSTFKLLGSGSFGHVYELQIDRSCYAIKMINIKNGIRKDFSRQLYKQYFLNCLADQLGVGPQIIPIFGYDLVITQNAVIFCMQKCSPLKSSQKAISKDQLTQALSVMHSIGFVHLDIKPENLAFSKNLQKHVFIDFGLSSLIKQKVGQKSLTSFKGTLHYCSQEMKKCYILGSNMFVDLYENDKVSLKKSLKQQEVLADRIYCEDSINVIKQYSFQRSTENENENKILGKWFSEILNLQNEIFKKNRNQAYNSLKKCIDLPRCCCHIFEKKNIWKQFINATQIKDTLKTMKDRMLTNPSSLASIDDQIYFYINEQSCSNLMHRSFPIQMFIKMQRQNFVRIFTQPNWLIKIFFFLNPFQSQTIKQDTKIWDNRKALIEKIFDSFASEEQMKLSNRFPNLISLKSQFTLHFFYERTKNLKNSKILVSLRLLFISTMLKFNKQLIFKLQQQILQLIQDNDYKILLIISFYFFWKVQNRQADKFYKYQQKLEWAKSILYDQTIFKSKSFRSSVSVFDALITDNYVWLSQFVVFQGDNKIVFQYFQQDNTKYCDIMNSLNYRITFQIGKILNINFGLYFYQNQQFAIYHSFSSKKQIFHLSSIKKYAGFVTVFVKFQYEFLKWASSLCENQHRNLFSNFELFDLLTEMGGIFPQFIVAFSKAIRKNYNNMKAFLSILFRQISKIQGQPFFKLNYLSSFLTHLQANLRQTGVSIPLTKEQVQQLTTKIKSLVYCLRQQNKQSSDIKAIDIKIKTIEIQLTLDDNQKRVGLSKQFYEQSFLPVYDDPWLMKCFLSIFLQFDREIKECKGYCYEGYYFRDSYEKLCEYIIQKNGMYVFNECEGFLQMLMKIKIQKKKMQQVFQYFLLAQNQIFVIDGCLGNKLNNVLIYYMLYFIDNCQEQFLLEKFRQIVRGKNKSRKGLCFVINLFWRVRFLLQKQQRILALYQIIQSVDCESNIRLIQKQIIMQFAIQIGLYKNCRQRLLFERRKDNYSYGSEQKRSTIWIRNRILLGQRINKSKIRNYLFNKNNNYYQYSNVIL